MCADTVTRLCDDIQKKNHKVSFDSFFCNILLLQTLKQWGIYGTDICRINRIQGAQLNLRSEKHLKEERGSYNSIVTNAENITVIQWLDSSLIHMGPTYFEVQSGVQGTP